MVDDEKAEALKNMYVELVIKSRQLYLDYRESHPDFFALVVKNLHCSHSYKILIKINIILYNIVVTHMSQLLMDDYAEAVDSLLDFIHKLCVNQSYKEPIFLSEINHLTQIAIPAALENIVDEMRE